MKKFSVSLLFVGVLSSQILWAAPKVVTSPAPSGRPTFYVGSALDGMFSPSGTMPAVSALWVLGEKTAVQFYLSMPTINPFLVGGGANLKYSIVGDNEKGFHVGGGVGTGLMNATSRTFYVNIIPSFGLHFELVDRVMMSFDSGINFAIATQGTNTFDITLGGRSMLLGLSVVYAL